MPVLPSKMEQIGEQRPLSPENWTVDDRIHDSKLTQKNNLYSDMLSLWPTAAAGYQELALQRLKLQEASTLRSYHKSESESRKRDATKELLREEELYRKECEQLGGEDSQDSGWMMVTELRNEAARNAGAAQEQFAYENDNDRDSNSESEIGVESGTDSESEIESENGSENENESDSNSDNWDWVHRYDFER
uniref:Uncharacterized protein n=1 Tax=Talaromyces marneffei PM1 TaxID=1077442 RepID=A0A093VBQ6_TALMA